MRLSPVGCSWPRALIFLSTRKRVSVLARLCLFISKPPKEYDTPTVFCSCCRQLAAQVGLAASSSDMKGQDVHDPSCAIVAHDYQSGFWAIRRSDESVPA